MSKLLPRHVSYSWGALGILFGSGFVANEGFGLGVIGKIAERVSARNLCVRKDQS